MSGVIWRFSSSQRVVASPSSVRFVCDAIIIAYIGEWVSITREDDFGVGFSEGVYEGFGFSEGEGSGKIWVNFVYQLKFGVYLEYMCYLFIFLF